MSLRSAFDATVGRRLLVRVWLHGIVLLVIIALAIDLVHRFVVTPGVRSNITGITAMLARDALALHEDPARLEAELRELSDRAHIELTVYRPDGTLAGSSHHPPPAPLGPAQLEALAAAPLHLQRTRCGSEPCVAVGAFDAKGLTAYAVVTPPPPPGSLRRSVIILGTVILLLALGSVPLALSIARPLERLGRLARELGSGNLAVRAETGRRDEVGDLARAFNDMAERVQQLRNAEKELLANVSHELRTPLARMRVVLELATEGKTENLRRYLGEISEDLTDLEQLLGDVIASARLDLREGKSGDPYPPLHRAPVVLQELVGTIASRFRERFPGRTLTCRAPDEPLVVEGDRTMLRRVLENLVENARRYSPEDRPIDVVLAQAEVDGPPAVRVEVRDEGMGIAPEDLPHVFTSFFRADRSRTRHTGGVGLGLSLSRRIVEAHGGGIELASELGRGTRIWFVLPRTVDA